MGTPARFEQAPTLPLGQYQHYKGGLYDVLGVGINTETLEYLVIYKPIHELSSTTFWVRPYEMFIESVEVEGKQVPRFQKIDN